MIISQFEHKAVNTKWAGISFEYVSILIFVYRIRDWRNRKKGNSIV